ncbi:MAG: LysR family transcriptional regulator [Myxococcota bacterium]
MSLDQLRYFVVVAEEENITRAASRLFVSQPPLSRQIRALEEELGTALFKRRHNGLKLLPAGRRLLKQARVILTAVDRLKGTVRDQR